MEEDNYITKLQKFLEIAECTEKKAHLVYVSERECGNRG